MCWTICNPNIQFLLVYGVDTESQQSKSAWEGLGMSSCGAMFVNYILSFIICEEKMLYVYMPVLRTNAL